jgi:hypothetical protein
MSYRDDPDWQDSPDKSWNERAAHWFLRETGDWLVPLVHHALGIFIFLKIIESMSNLEWQDIAKLLVP